MASSTETSPPLSLTERQQAEVAGTDLLKVVSSLPAGTRLDSDQLERLRNWLFGHGSADLRAIAHLTKIVVRVLPAGTLDDADALDFYLGIERLLPLTERGITRALAGSPDNGVRGDWRGDPMTDAQRNYLTALGSTVAAGTKKGEAALLIDQLLRKRPIGSRQQMEMRFWNRKPGAEEGPREISDWQVRFKLEDPDRQAAWDLFYQEAGENGLKGDPLRVPVGAGRSYLKRVKKGGAQAEPRIGSDPTRPKSAVAGPLWHWSLGLGTAGAVAAIFFFTFRTPPPAPAPSRPGAVRTVPTVRPVPKVVQSVPTVQPAPTVERAVKVRPEPIVEAKANPDAAELISYARKIRLSAIVTIRGQHVAMINGVQFRVGSFIGPANDYTVTEINPVTRSVMLTDGKGNSVRRLIE